MSLTNEPVPVEIIWLCTTRPVGAGESARCVWTLRETSALVHGGMEWGQGANLDRTLRGALEAARFREPANPSCRLRHLIVGPAAERSTSRMRHAPQIPSVTDTDLAEIGVAGDQDSDSGDQSAGGVPKSASLPRRHARRRERAVRGPRRDGPSLYEAQWTLDPNETGWSDPVAFPNSRSFNFSGLERGKDVWVRVRAVNTKGPGPRGDPASIMVI
jgi:hypothetical protein